MVHLAQVPARMVRRDGLALYTTEGRRALTLSGDWDLRRGNRDSLIRLRKQPQPVQTDRREGPASGRSHTPDEWRERHYLTGRPRSKFSAAHWRAPLLRAGPLHRNIQ